MASMLQFESGSGRRPVMKRTLIGALVGAVLLVVAIPVQAQGGFGRGRGACWKQGGANCSRRMGIGLRNGRGPRAFSGTCPPLAFNSQPAAPNAATPASGAQADSAVVPFGRDRGLMNGTGPRALNGTCPRLGLNAPAANPSTADTPSESPAPQGKAVTK